MHATTTILALIAGLTASANGMTIDAATADGVYTFDVANSTVLHFEPLDNIVKTPARAMRRNGLAARGLPGSGVDVQCTPHDVSQNGDEHRAWEILVNFCDGNSNTKGHHGVFAKVAVSISDLIGPRMLSPSPPVSAIDLWRL